MSPFQPATPSPPPLHVCVEQHKGLFIRVGQGEEISFRSKNRGCKSEMETTGLHIWSYYKVSSRLPRKRRHSCPCYKDQGPSALIQPHSWTHIHQSNVSKKAYLIACTLELTHILDQTRARPKHRRPPVLPTCTKSSLPLLNKTSFNSLFQTLWHTRQNECILLPVHLWPPTFSL